MTVHNRKAATEDIVAAYRETGSVWKTAKLLGMAGQSVHERLRAIGYPLRARNWTAEETAELHHLVENQVPLGEIAYRLGRPYAGVACQASRTGAKSVHQRQKKIPRGEGYDKASTLKNIKELETSSKTVTQYARSVGLNVDTLVYAFQRHCPERWQQYLSTHSPLPEKVCEYCEVSYVPANAKQRFCTRKCGTRSHSDRNYFGGRRRHTVGLAEGICQLCTRAAAKGLSSHHMLGKENDPDNLELVALCQGCHQIVTLLGGRAFVDDPRAWESLIALAWTRRHGPEIAAAPNGRMLYTEVHIEDDEPDGDEMEAAS